MRQANDVAAPHTRYIKSATPCASRIHPARPPAGGVVSTWTEIPADEIGEALLQAWWVNGIDHVLVPRAPTWSGPKRAR